MHLLLILSEYIFILPLSINMQIFFLNSILLIINCFLRLLSCFVTVIAGQHQDISEQYTAVEHNICMYRKNIYNVKSTLQKVLTCWATYVENLLLLKACFEETKKEQMKEVFSFSVYWCLLNFTFFFSFCLEIFIFNPKMRGQGTVSMIHSKILQGVEMSLVSF